MSENTDQPGGDVGNPFRGNVPKDVAEFFGSEAPEPEPSVEWTEEQERAAREQMAQKSAAEKAVTATKTPATASTPAAKSTGQPADQSSAKSDSEQELVTTGLDAEADLFAGFGSGILDPADAPPAPVAGPVGKGRSSRATAASEPTHPTQPRRPAVAAARSADTTEKPSPGSVRRSVVEVPPEPTAEDPTDEPADSRTLGQTIRSHWDSLIESLGIGGKGKAQKNRPEPEAAEASKPGSQPRSRRKAEPLAEDLADGSTGERHADTKAEPMEEPTEIPADAFGFGIFERPVEKPQVDPLDDLFAASPPAAAVDPPAARRPAERPMERRAGPSAVPPQVRAEPSDDLSSDEIEFDVVDLDGDDISSLWVEPQPRKSAAEVRPPRAKRPVAGDRQPPTDVEGDPAPRVRSPRRRPAEVLEPAWDEADDREVEPAGGRPSHPGRSRPRPERSVPEQRRAEAPGRNPYLGGAASGGAVELPEEGPMDPPPRAGVGRGRRAPRSGGSPAAGTARGTTSQGDSEPGVAEPGAEVPRRRPVPTWRRVVDHIVDLNLGNRRGSGGRRRSQSPQRPEPSVGGAPRSREPEGRSSDRGGPGRPVNGRSSMESGSVEPPAPDSPPARGGRGRRRY